MRNVELFDLGRSEYQPTWDLQAAVQKRIIDEKLDVRRNGMPEHKRSNDVFLLVEHPHVYTLGKSGDANNLLKNEDELRDIDAQFVPIDRGGDITYHGPGQIVGYPILDLERYHIGVHQYVENLERVIIRTCNDYNIDAEIIDGLPGVWVDDAKICAIGIKCSRYVSMHGFAFNVNTDLGYFENIVPCGIQDKEVTSLQKLAGYSLDMQEVKNRITQHFEEVFDVSIIKDGELPELQEQFSYLK